LPLINHDGVDSRSIHRNDKSGTGMNDDNEDEEDEESDEE
jgi:hypothetical protein